MKIKVIEFLFHKFGIDVESELLNDVKFDKEEPCINFLKSFPQRIDILLKREYFFAKIPKFWNEFEQKLSAACQNVIDKHK